MPNARRNPETSKQGAVALALLRESSARDLAHALQSFVAALSGTEIPKHAQILLPEALMRADRLGLGRVEIADACEVSEATVSRWASKQVTPHLIVARAAINAIRDMALRKAHESEEQASREAVLAQRR
jgi:hypothetical protein